MAKAFRDRIVSFKRLNRSLIDEHPGNFRRHGSEQADAVRAAMEELGVYDCVIVRPKGKRFELVDGHLRHALLDDRKQVPALIVNLSAAEARSALATHDAIAGMASVDRAAMADLLRELEGASEQLDMLCSAAAAAEGVEFLTEEDFAEEATGPATVPPEVAEPAETRAEVREARAEKLREEFGVETGSLWRADGVGSHHLWCGDSTSAAWSAVIAKARLDWMITDPPYSTGKALSSNSEGKVNTRNFGALLRAVLERLGKLKGVYIHTDWRNWAALEELLGAKALGMRAMIAWDKGSPMLGRGWRSQHELVALATHGSVKWIEKHCHGNVVQCSRSGNLHHPLEKPLELERKLLEVAQAARVVADPFAGSGTTAVACECEGRDSWSAELDPTYVSVALDRLVKQGCKVERVG